MRTLLIFTTALALAGCASLFEPIVYKLPTRQGNVIEQKQLDQLKLGMTREQVKFLLGTPIAASPFRDERWDYLGYYKGPRGKPASRTVSLYFENEQLKKMEGIVLAEADIKADKPLTMPDTKTLLQSEAKDKLEDERSKQDPRIGVDEEVLNPSSSTP